MKSIKFELTFNEGAWTARCDKFASTGKTLYELDKDIKDNLKSGFQRGERVEVKMEFDYDTFPFWITQYQPHYLNRVVHLEF